MNMANDLLAAASRQEHFWFSGFRGFRAGPRAHSF
jgi:hypothetical protein